METVAKRLYEGMFLVDSAQAAADWDGTLSVISTILQRADADVVSMQKWQERKLAYDIDHKTRGTYILCYFRADGVRIAGIEKDVLLSEKVMRVLVLGTEKRPAEMIERDIKGEPEAKPAERAPAPEKVAPAPAAPTEASAEPRQDDEPEAPAKDDEPGDSADAPAAARQDDKPEESTDTPLEQADASRPEAAAAPALEREASAEAPALEPEAGAAEPEKAAE